MRFPPAVRYAHSMRICRRHRLAPLLALLLPGCLASPEPAVVGCGVSPVVLDFGETGVGLPVERSFTIDNHGSSSFTTRASSSCSSFAVTSPSYRLRPGESIAITVRFAPPAVGEYQCVVQTLSGCVDVVCRGSAVSLAGDMVRIDAGTFTMGSPVTETGHQLGENLHEVTISAPFLMGVREITQARYRMLTGESPSASVIAGDDAPVEMVSWYDAVRFCNALSVSEGLRAVYAIEGMEVSWAREGNGYRLPTEAEWEYACRGGTTTELSTGALTAQGCDPDSLLEELGWYCGNAASTTHATGAKDAGAHGLFDMHGNVAEWVWDYYAALSLGAETDPSGPPTGGTRVIRGGGWNDFAIGCRSAARPQFHPAGMAQFVGFRVVRNAVD
ncbi:MAG: hypothetical protein CME07_00300 [Gemmatimonadetes bacterium]|nr:hypothetical protein [Gemmatimonadota bacterium]